MKNPYILFIFISIFFCFFSINVKAQENYIEIYTGAGNTFNSRGYTNFNADFSYIFTSAEPAIYSIYAPIDYYLGLMLNKRYIFFNLEIEIANFFSVSSDSFSYCLSGFINYFKGGAGFYFTLGPFSLKISANTGVGFYLLKVFDVKNTENLQYIGQILADGFIFIEPEVAIGVKLGTNLIIYLGHYV